jgi:hypothetical protein
MMKTPYCFFVWMCKSPAVIGGAFDYTVALMSFFAGATRFAIATAASATAAIKAICLILLPMMRSSFVIFIVRLDCRLFFCFVTGAHCRGDAKLLASSNVYVTYVIN